MFFNDVPFSNLTSILETCSHLSKSIIFRSELPSEARTSFLLPLIFARPHPYAIRLFLGIFLVSFRTSSKLSTVLISHTKTVLSLQVNCMAYLSSFIRVRPSPKYLCSSDSEANLSNWHFVMSY